MTLCGLGKTNSFSENDAIDTHWPRNVLDALLPHVLERDIELAGDLLVHHPASANPTRFRQGFEPSGYINTVAKDILRFDNYIAEVDPYSEADAFVFRQFDIAFDHPALHVNRAADRIHDTAEFHQHAVAGVLYDAPAVLFDLRIDQLAKKYLEVLLRPLLVRFHEARVAHHIGGKNGGQPAFDASRGQGALPNRVAR